MILDIFPPLILRNFHHFSIFFGTCRKSSAAPRTNWCSSELKRSWLGKRLLSYSIWDLCCTLCRFLARSDTSGYVFVVVFFVFCYFWTNPRIWRPTCWNPLNWCPTFTQDYIFLTASLVTVYHYRQIFFVVSILSRANCMKLLLF